MLVIDKNIFEQRENIKFYGDDRDKELLTKIILLEDQVISDYLIDTFINYQQSIMLEDYLKSELNARREEIEIAKEQIEMLKKRRASLQQQKSAMNTLKGIISDATGVVKGVMNVVKETAYMAFNAVYAVVTLDGSAFIDSIVSGVKGIVGGMFETVCSSLKFVWNRITDLGNHIAWACNDMGIDFVGDGLLFLGKFVVKMINVICSDMGQKVLAVGLPIVMGATAAATTGGAAAVGGAAAGAELAGQISMGCAAAQIGGVALTLQMDSFEKELRQTDEAEVNKQIKKTQQILKDIEAQAKMTAVDIINERKRQKCYELKTSLVLSCVTFYDSLFYEYPGLTPENALRVYLNSIGKSAFDTIIKSGVVPYTEIKDLLGVLVKAADDKFSGEVRCERFEPGFARFLSEIHGVSESSYCAYIGRSQIDALKEVYNKTFEFESQSESMTMREFLSKYGDIINKKAREIATQKAFLYKDLLNIKNAADLEKMLIYKNIDYKKVFPKDLSLYSGDELLSFKKEKTKKIILWTLIVSGSIFTAWKIYDNVKKIKKGEA